MSQMDAHFYPVPLRPHKSYYWCSCGKSNKLPFCDGSHKGSEFKPLSFSCPQEETSQLCGCGQTGTPPFCDHRFQCTQIQCTQDPCSV